MANQIRNFLKGGGSVSGVQRAGVLPASLGTVIDGKVYQHPRVTLNRIKGRSVTVTNPAAAVHTLAQRTQSIGANAAGQQKRHNQA